MTLFYGSTFFVEIGNLNVQIAILFEKHLCAIYSKSIKLKFGERNKTMPVKLVFFQFHTHTRPISSNVNNINQIQIGMYILVKSSTKLFNNGRHVSYINHCQ